VGSSRRNFLEAEIAARLVSDIAACPDSKNLSIAIISFYRAQVELLRDCLKEDRELDGILRLGRDVNTVDQFQGSERDVVIVSLVRSDARLSGEFARDFRRINVALSRARKLLIVLGSQASFGDADVLTPGLDGKNHNTKAYWQIQELIHRHGALLDASAVLGKKSAQ
jgi:superfamily I DNA and/or RNA helicase